MTETKKSGFKTFSKIFRIVKNIVFGVVLAFLVGVIILTIMTRANGETPFIFGYSVQRVLTGSMEPTLEVGDVILCHQVDPMTIEKDDIITYKGIRGSFKDKPVTHRVVKAPYKDGDAYYIVTKGDNNPIEDSPIPISSVMGKFETKIAFLEPLYNFFITPLGLLTIIGLIILVFFNEIVIFVKSLIVKDEEPANVDEIIERYYKENAEKSQDKAQVEASSKTESDESSEDESAPPSDESDDNTDSTTQD